MIWIRDLIVIREAASDTLPLHHPVATHFRTCTKNYIRLVECKCTQCINDAGLSHEIPLSRLIDIIASKGSRWINATSLNHPPSHIIIFPHRPCVGMMEMQSMKDEGR